jgi:hypothetical protein
MPRKSTVLTSASSVTALTRSMSSENVRAYQADTSETVLIVSGRDAL